MGKMYYFCAILHMLILGFAVWSSLATNTTGFGCISGERNALLKLKESFEDSFNRLSSWRSSVDCCTWKGVMCDSNTGRVVGLRLRNTNWWSYYVDESSVYNYSLTSNHLDSSLLELKYLSYLELSGNDFQLSPVPAFLGSMKRLQHLNLSNANFSGGVPHNLGNLSSLKVLDLRQVGSDMLIDDLMWASNLSSMEYLDMSSVDLSRAKHLYEVLFHMLPSILVLRLSRTQLDNTHLPHSCVNSSLLSNIQHLDLGSNSFDGEFPCFLHNMTSLRFLDLSRNHYNSSSPRVHRLRNLVRLDLSFNSLHHKADWISDLLLNNCHLKSLKMHANKFYGELSTKLLKNSSMVYCWTHELETLDLSDNQFDGHLPQEMSVLKQLNVLDFSVNGFTGPIPISIGELKQLITLDFSDNALTGSIPTSIGKLRGLRYLLLLNNHLSGELPISLGQLSNIEKIDIYGNSFNGTLSELHFAKFSKLEEFWANSMNLSVPFDWVPPFQLKYLLLSSFIIGSGGQFPQWVRTQKALDILKLSNCSISGSLPEWLNYLNLTVIDLPHNMINGSIPKLPPYLEYLDLSDNQIDGPILKFGSSLYSLRVSDNMMNGSMPDSLCQLKALEHLDLSKNRFSGNIPKCWANLRVLNALILSSNEFSGVIPNSIGEASSLEWLNLSNNSLTGQLPATLKNCTELEDLDVRENMLSGNLPDWIGSHLNNLKVLGLGKNEFYGVIPHTFCQLSDLQVMDLANNRLIGYIPNCFGNLFGMKKYSKIFDDGGFYQSLSQVLKGVELEYTSTLGYLVNLDLSNNNLVGEIPWELTNHSGLIGLNLSHNHLGGKIPINIGDMKQLESLDFSSNNLHGEIPRSLSDLDSLEYLNLSHNHLSGPIPTGRHFQTFEDPSIYKGNPGLCGAPLPKKCREDGTAKSPNVDENDRAEDEDDKNDKIIFYGIIASGFATGFWGIIGVLVLKRSWRYAFFQFAEDMMAKCWGYSYIECAKLNNKQVIE